MFRVEQASRLRLKSPAPGAARVGVASRGRLTHPSPNLAPPNKVEFLASLRYNVFMVKLNEKYMTDRAGRPTDVVLSRKPNAALAA
jgi:hypothetical protein